MCIGTAGTIRWIGVVLCEVLFVGCAGDSAVVVGVESALSYVLSCQKPDGGFGPRYQPYADLDWSYHAASALSALAVPVPNRDACASFCSGPSRRRLTAEEEFTAASLCALLGEVSAVQRDLVVRSRQQPDGGWPGADGRATLSATYRAISTLAAWGAAPLNPQAAGTFIVNRLYPDGHFDDTPRPKTEFDSPDVATEQDTASSGGRGGQVWLTYCGVMGLTDLGYEVPWSRSVVQWLRSCQQPDGGFSWRPVADSLGGSDIWYTWLALEALRALGAVPADSAGAAAFINSCQNADGGFGDRPGWASRLAATDYALLAAKALSGDVAATVRPKVVVSTGRPPAAWRNMGVYHLYEGPGADDETHESGSPWSPGLPVYQTGEDLDEAEPYLRTRALAVKDSALDHFLLQLRHPARLSSLANGTVIWRTIGFWVGNQCHPDTIRALHAAWDVLNAESAADTLAWGRLHDDVLRPLAERGVIPYERLGAGDQVAGYLITGELLAQPRGSCAVAAALSDGEDLVRSDPVMERLVGRVPLVVPLAASTDVPRDRARLVWLGTRGDADDLREALRDGRAACAIRDDDVAGGLVLYGPTDLVAALYGRANEVRWWKAGIAQE